MQGVVLSFAFLGLYSLWKTRPLSIVETGIILTAIYVVVRHVLRWKYFKVGTDEHYFGGIIQLSDLRALNPVEFENLIGDLFRRMGYSVKTTPRTGDEGIDLFVEKGSKKAVVQCKRYTGNVGQPVLRDLYGAMIHNRADEAYIITTGTITLHAQQWAAGKPIHLVDGNELVKWMRSFQLLVPVQTSELTITE